jgi:hypothetical protein
VISEEEKGEMNASNFIQNAQKMVGQCEFDKSGNEQTFYFKEFVASVYEPANEENILGDDHNLDYI